VLIRLNQIVRDWADNSLQIFLWHSGIRWRKDVRRNNSTDFCRSRRPSAGGIELVNVAFGPNTRYVRRGNIIPISATMANHA
jgi:hypothetical protein